MKSKWFWINALEIVCKLPILSVKLIYRGFFATFQFASFPYILFLWKLSDSIMWIYSFKRKKHYHLHLQPRQYMSISPHLHFYANYPSFGRFCWRQKCCLWFLRCLPFCAPYLFRLSRFFKLHSQTFHSSVLMQEEKCCSWIKSCNTLQYHITWFFLVSFVLLLSPKQSRCFTNLHLQLIGNIWLTEKVSFTINTKGQGLKTSAAHLQLNSPLVHPPPPVPWSHVKRPKSRVISDCLRHKTSNTVLFWLV